MKIILRLNAENGKLVYHPYTVEGDRDTVRVMNVAQQILDAIERGAGDKLRTKEQMPVCPFVITIHIVAVKHNTLSARVDYKFNKHCTSGMLGAGMGTVARLRELVESTAK